MTIWICIPVFNRKDLTLKCLASLQKQTYTNVNIVICDHGSTDGTTTAIHQQYPHVTVINADSSLWWTGAINRCVKYVLKNAQEGDSILTLNDDTELLDDYLFNIAKTFDKYPHSIITSPILNIETKAIVDIGYRFNWLLATSTPVNFEDHHIPNDNNIIEITHASGRGTLFPIDLFKKIGLYRVVLRSGL